MHQDGRARAARCQVSTEHPALEATNLSKSFVTRRDLIGRPTSWVDAVKDVSVTVRRGESIGLVGESGAGKSTVGRLVLRLIEPDRGAVFVAGQDVRAMDTRALRRFRARGRMIFQDPFASMDPTMTVAQIVGEPLLIHENLDRADRRRRVAELLDSVGMSRDHIDRHPHEFSGGQLQRIAVARAISTNPELIVCDEAVAALDMSIRAQVINLLRDMQDERDIGYLFISHDLSLVGHIAAQVAVMYRGRIVEFGPTEGIFRSPHHPYTRDLLLAIPDLESKRVAERPHQRVSTDAQMDLAGCDYADRCPEAMEMCANVRPEPRTVDSALVACHLYPESMTPVSVRSTSES